MPLKNTLQKAANGCFSNKIETDSPENVMFPGGCDYEVIEIMKIFGTDYTFEHNTEMCTKLNIDGMCQQYNRKITVRNMNDMLEDDADADAKKKMRYNEVCRHEAIHGYFGEVGLERYNNDETLVTFLAVNFPKMVELFKSQGWLE